MIDLDEPKEEVEVILRDGCLWVNVDGRCRLRVIHIKPEMLKLVYRPADWMPKH
jgi:hypothetical protein